jgi:hypothetical protein
MTSEGHTLQACYVKRQITSEEIELDIKQSIIITLCRTRNVISLYVNLVDWTYQFSGQIM